MTGPDRTGAPMACALEHAADTAAMVRNHVRVQDLLLAHGSAAQREFVVAEAGAGRRFAGAWAAVAASAERVPDALEAGGGLRLLPRPAGGRLLIGYQEVPAHSATADWAVFRVHDGGNDLLVLVPHGTPRLCFDVLDGATDGAEPPARALLHGVRVLDSLLIPLPATAAASAHTHCPVPQPA